MNAQANAPWWDKNWSGRKPVTLNADVEGSVIKEDLDETVFLVRLHQGNFPFDAAREDGSDLRFVTEDGKTVLPFHIEKWDSLMLEAILWVRSPDSAANGKVPIWLYYGNAEPPAENAPNSAETFPESTALVYHFAERGSSPKDATAAGNHAVGAGTISEGSLIGPGLRLLGGDLIEIPASPSLEWTPGGAWAWSAWIKAASPIAEAIILSRSEGNHALRVGLADTVPFVEITEAGRKNRSAAGDSVAVTSWTRLDVVASAGELLLYVNGKEYSKLEASLPAMNVPFFLGGDAAPEAAAARFVGEVDEMRMATIAASPGLIAFSALNQSGSEAAGNLLEFGADEGSHGGHSEALEHVMLFGDIAKNMMFDGWIAIGVCVLMILTGWTVAVRKYVLLARIQKGNEEFQRQWKHVSSDLTALDLDDPEAAKSFGKKLSKKALWQLEDSPLYHVYHVGAEEIRHRLGRGKNNGQGLSARSIQAIRAALDAGLVREQHRLNKGIVLLTISIAGGPYVGLLGTVVGVMITFAIIAKSGDVDVNSIAPGIASALLATVAGLIVAIPALFIYSYLASRIKESISSMQVFIDEFVAKVAEFYPTPADAGNAVPIRQIRLPEHAEKLEANQEDKPETRS